MFAKADGLSLLYRAKLREQGQDAGFMQMLHTLDCSDMDLEAKWALVQKHTADKADFRFALYCPLCLDT